MNNRYYQSLQDIIDSINRIDVYVGNPKIFEHYDSNVQLRQAVERNFEIIGEAVKRLEELDPELEISNSRKIINLRNKISHGYDEVENEQVWNVIINHLPVLKIEVEKLLNSK